MANFSSVVQFLQVDFGLWVTFLGMVGDHPWDGWRPVTILGIFDDHPWQLAHGLNLASLVYMPNSKSVVHFLLERFWCGLLLSCCDGEKTKSTPSPTDLNWTVRLDWSLTTLPFWPQLCWYFIVNVAHNSWTCLLSRCWRWKKFQIFSIWYSLLRHESNTCPEASISKEIYGG